MLRELSLSQGLEWTPFRGKIYTLWPASCGRRKTHPPGVIQKALLEDFGERFWNNLMVTSRSRRHWCCFGGHRPNWQPSRDVSIPKEGIQQAVEKVPTGYGGKCPFPNKPFSWGEGEKKVPYICRNTSFFFPIFLSSPGNPLVLSLAHTPTLHGPDSHQTQESEPATSHWKGKVELEIHPETPAFLWKQVTPCFDRKQRIAVWGDSLCNMLLNRFVPFYLQGIKDHSGFFKL